MCLSVKDCFFRAESEYGRDYQHGLVAPDILVYYSKLQFICVYLFDWHLIIFQSGKAVMAETIKMAGQPSFSSAAVQESCPCKLSTLMCLSVKDCFFRAESEYGWDYQHGLVAPDILVYYSKLHFICVYLFDWHLIIFQIYLKLSWTVWSMFVCHMLSLLGEQYLESLFLVNWNLL